jgi:ribosomal protein S9
MVHGVQDIWRNTIGIARSTNPRPNSTSARHSDATRVAIRPCKPLNMVPSRCDVQPQLRDTNQRIALRCVFCLFGPAQAIACKVTIVGGGRHDARSFAFRQERSRASMHFDLCDLPALQAAKEMLHRKARRFRQRGDVLHGAAADIALRRRSLLAAAVNSPSTLLRALWHEARVHILASKN